MSMPGIGELSRADDLAQFVEELRKRRDRVYDYIDNWPGAADFKPEDIHDGIFSYVRHRGKGLRPSLLMLSAGAVGGSEEQAIPAAAAVEIFHIWTLVHDDIIDRDDMRRGHPTVHAQYADQGGKQYGLNAHEAAHYGTAVAILSGDLQQSWSFALLCDLIERGVDPAIVLKLIQRMATTLTPRLLEGELLDVQFALSPPGDLTQDQILNMLAGKTAALLEYAAWAGATIGLGGQEDTEDYANNIGRFARLSGLAFQLQDDVLGLTADEAKLGKPVGSDLREGKRTLILHYALEGASDVERETLMSILGNREATERETAAVLDIIQKSGAIQKVEALADSLIKQSLNGLEILPESSEKQLLRSWSSFLLARSY
jgi:geranylgeranyl diphosphate synthase type I